MDAKEVKQKLDELQKLILDKVDKFYNETGVCVSSIRYDAISIFSLGDGRTTATGSCYVGLDR